MIPVTVTGAEISEKDSVRWWAKVIPTEGCWVWTGALSRAIDGYAYMILRGRQVRAHRVAYIMLRGAIPDGHDLHHVCENKSCVNPWHLEPIRRGPHILLHDGTGAMHKRKTHCCNGHEFSEDNTRITKSPTGSSRRVCRACEKERKDH